MANWKIPIYKIYWDKNDVGSVEKVIRRGAYWTNGPEVKEFENLVAKYVGRKFAVSFNSGTSALHALTSSYGFKHGDEVIVPSFTFISTANSVLFSGAKPVFADIEDKSLALDVADVRKKITEKTKAIMPIHYGGSPAIEIEKLRELAEEKGMILIEDAAESLGAKINNKKIGSFGDSAMISFCGNKVITTGEGGMIVTDNEELHKKLILFRSHGRLETENYFESSTSMDYISLGYNFRMNSITAALGTSQMKKLDKVISMRRKVAKQYDAIFSSLKNLEMPFSNNSIFNVYQLYSLRFKDNETRSKIQKMLDTQRIMSKVYFEPIHKTHFYKNVMGYKSVLEKTENVASRILTIPLYANMTKQNVDFVGNVVKNALSTGG